MQKLPFTARGTASSGRTTVTVGGGPEVAGEHGAMPDALSQAAVDYYGSVCPAGEQTLSAVLTVTAGVE